MKRVITFTMYIDEETGNSSVLREVTENGERKEKWKSSEATFTAMVLMDAARNLIEGVNEVLYNEKKEDEK